MDADREKNLQIALGLTTGVRGNFMRKLGEAYCVADSGNQRRLVQAFPHVFTGGSDVEEAVEVQRAEP